MSKVHSSGDKKPLERRGRATFSGKEETALPASAAPSGAGQSAEPPADEGAVQDHRGKLALVWGIPLEVTVIMGKTRLPLGALFSLNRGSVITFEQVAGEPAVILINDQPVARGDVVLVDDQFGVRITEHLLHGEPADNNFLR